MCLALARRGHHVALVATDDYPAGADGLAPNVDVRLFPVHWPRRYFASLPMIPALRHMVPRFDVVHIHSLYLFHSLVAARTCSAAGVPYIMRPHGTLDPYLRRKSRFKKDLYDRLLQRRELDRAAAVHYTSEDERDLATPLGIRARPMVVPLGIDLNEFDHMPPAGAFRRAHPELRDKRLVLFLGRITPKKGLDLLAAAFGEVQRVDPNAHLVIAGPDDEGYGGHVRRFLADAGVTSATTILPMTTGTAKLELLRDADVWVLPSYTENFGVAVVEAMAASLPVVISNRVNIWSRVDAAGAGLVTGCDAHQVAASVCRVLGDAHLASRLRSEGHALAYEAFGWDGVAVQLERAYYDVLDRPASVQRAGIAV
jgi:glycosyltransferase involved in cell wall biosynthesis